MDTEAIDGAASQAVRRRVVISGEDDTVKIGSLLLDGFHCAPEHSLAAAAVVRVRMEESHRPFPAFSRVDHGERQTQRYGEECCEEGIENEADRHGS